MWDAIFMINVRFFFKSKVLIKILQLLLRANTNCCFRPEFGDVSHALLHQLRANALLAPRQKHGEAPNTAVAVAKPRW